MRHFDWFLAAGLVLASVLFAGAAMADDERYGYGGPDYAPVTVYVDSALPHESQRLVHKAVAHALPAGVRLVHRARHADYILYVDGTLAPAHFHERRSAYDRVAFSNKRRLKALVGGYGVALYAEYEKVRGTVSGEYDLRFRLKAMGRGRYDRGRGGRARIDDYVAEKVSFGRNLRIYTHDGWRKGHVYPDRSVRRLFRNAQRMDRLAARLDAALYDSLAYKLQASGVFEGLGTRVYDGPGHHAQRDRRHDRRGRDHIRGGYTGQTGLLDY